MKSIKVDRMIDPNRLRITINNIDNRKEIVDTIPDVYIYCPNKTLPFNDMTPIIQVKKEEIIEEALGKKESQQLKKDNKKNQDEQYEFNIHFMNQYEKLLNQSMNLIHTTGKKINFKSVQSSIFKRLDIGESEYQWYCHLEKDINEEFSSAHKMIIPLVETSRLQNFRVGQSIVESIMHFNKGHYVIEIENSPIGWGIMSRIEGFKNTVCAYECDKLSNKEKIESLLNEYTNQWQFILSENKKIENWPIKIAKDAIKNNFKLLSYEETHYYESLIDQYTIEENYSKILKAPIYINIYTSQGMRASYGKTVKLSDNIVNEIILMTKKSVFEDPQYEQIHESEWEDSIIRVDFLINFRKIGQFNISLVERDKRFEDENDKGILLANDSKRGLVLPNMIDDFSQVKAIKVAMIKGGFDKKDKFDIYTFDSIRYI